MDDRAALVIIDMQMEMQHRIDTGRPCVNPDAPAAIQALATAFRDAGCPLIHIRHGDADPSSPMHVNAPGHVPMACAQDLPNEAVFVKTTSSAFPSTDLEGHLRERGIAHLVVVGAVAGFCVNSTVRSACDLGFAVTVVTDAVIGFDLPSAGLDARTIFDVTMGLLAADFAELRDSRAVIVAL
jgi:nicotinamidase-related amidase